MAEHVRDGAHEHAHHWLVERREFVVHPQAVLARDHQMLPPQIRQVARHGWLRQAEALMDVADADLSAGEQSKNPQARGIRKGFEGVLETGEPGVFHVTSIYFFAHIVGRERLASK